MWTFFSNIVCGETGVRNALIGSGYFEAWWRMVLFLHGKPAPVTNLESERRDCVARGFRFYATLYSWVSVILMLCGVGLGIAGASLFSVGAVTIAGGLLVCVARFGHHAAAEYARGGDTGRLHLTIFMVSLMLFLTSFLTAASMIIAGSNIIPATANLFITGCLIVFGVGSYFIEVVYLATG